MSKSETTIENNVTIYVLFDIKKPNEIKYIGKTKKSIRKRLSEYKYGAKKFKKTYKDKWINSVYEKNSKVEIQLLEIVKESEWEEKERYWILFYKNKGFKLTNLHPGGQSGPRGCGKRKYFITYFEYKIWINKNYPDLIFKREFKKVKHKFPNFIPKNPESVFKNKGWTGFESLFLKKENGYKFNSHKKNFLNYKDAKIWLKTNDCNFSTLYQYRFYIKKNKINFLPYNPEKTYKNEWIELEDFFENYNTKYSKKDFLQFNEAKNWLKINRPDLKSCLQYAKEKTNKTLPHFLPFHPERSYKNSGWNGYSDFFGKNFLTYEEVKKIMIKNKIKTNKEFRIFQKQHINTIPSNPEQIYKTEWIDWYEFLGNKKNYFRFSKTSSINPNSLASVGFIQ